MGGMGYLKNLTSAEISAIAGYIANPNATPVPAPAPSPTPLQGGLWNTIPVTILAEDDLVTAYANGKLWFIKSEDNQIGYFDAANKTAKPVVFNLEVNSGAKAIAAGPDARMWFTESKTNKVGAIDASGSIKLYLPTSANSRPYGISAGGDGKIWFTENATNKIGVMNVDGSMAAELVVATPAAGLGAMVKGLNNTMWFVERDAGKLGRIDVTTRALVEFNLPAGSKPKNITVNPTNGYVWVTDPGRNKVMRINPATGLVEKEFDVAAGQPDRIMLCNSQEIYFTLLNKSKVGRIDNADKLAIYKLRADDSNDAYRVHDLLEDASGQFWFTNTPSSALVATGAATNTTAEAQFAAESSVLANPVIEAALPANVAPQNAGAGGCATQPGGKTDPTLPLMLFAALVYLRRKLAR